MMRKIALICRRNPSDWVSCRSITRNLVRSYELGFPDSDIRVFHMEEDFAFVRFERLAGDIVAFSPDAISFVDHHPHPAALLELLARKFAGAWPRLYVHVFGDFTVMPNEWLRIEGLLRSANPVFICASEKQRKLVASFLVSAQTAVSIPFPVDRSVFNHEEGAYARLRKEAGIPESESILLYAGRLSLQKNVLHLLRSFALYMQFNPAAQLWLAGPVDDLGIPYIGQISRPGFLATDLIELREQLFPKEQRNRIRYCGDLDAGRLADLYRMTDAYVSFSTHNDEDFGMAPAEAWCCGLPLVLSDWGGYSSFGPRAVRHVPVRLVGGRIQADLNATVKAIAAAVADPERIPNRPAISRDAHDFCSCEAVSRKLAELAQAKSGAEARFSGFSDKFEQLARAYRVNPKAPFRAGEGYSRLYQDLYEPYF